MAQAAARQLSQCSEKELALLMWTDARRFSIRPCSGLGTATAADDTLNAESGTAAFSAAWLVALRMGTLVVDAFLAVQQDAEVFEGAEAEAEGSQESLIGSGRGAAAGSLVMGGVDSGESICHGNSPSSHALTDGSDSESAGGCPEGSSSIAAQAEVLHQMRSVLDHVEVVFKGLGEEG